MNHFSNTEMSSTTIKIRSFDDIKRYFKPGTKSMIHCAVKRKWYKHHFIVLGHTWCSTCNLCDIIHFTTRATENCKGKVRLEKYYKENFENDIKNGLFIFKNKSYPTNEKAYSQAYQRFEERQNEGGFSIDQNNCEHLVNYILTGTAVSKQVKDSTCFKRWLIHSCDILTASRCKYFFKTLICAVLRTLLLVAFSIYVRHQLRETLENQEKNGVFDKLREMPIGLLRLWKGFFLKGNELSDYEKCFIKALNSVFTIDLPMTVVDNHAIALLQNCTFYFRFLVVSTTIIIEIFTVHCALGCLSRKTISVKPENFEKEKYKVLILCFVEIIVCMIFLYQNSVYSSAELVFLGSLIENLVSYFLGFWVIEIFNNLF